MHSRLKYPFAALIVLALSAPALADAPEGDASSTTPEGDASSTTPEAQGAQSKDVPKKPIRKPIRRPIRKPIRKPIKRPGKPPKKPGKKPVGKPKVAPKLCALELLSVAPVFPANTKRMHFAFTVKNTGEGPCGHPNAPHRHFFKIANYTITTKYRINVPDTAGGFYFETIGPITDTNIEFPGPSRKYPELGEIPANGTAVLRFSPPNGYCLAGKCIADSVEATMLVSLAYFPSPTSTGKIGSQVLIRRVRVAAQ